MDTIDDPGVFSILVQCMFSFIGLDSSKAYHILQRGTEDTDKASHICVVFTNTHINVSSLT